MHTLQIKVVPSSGKVGCVLNKNNEITCFVKSAAERGKANKELIKYLAKKLSLTQDCVRIRAGKTSRKKIIAFNTEMTMKQILSAIGIDKQQSLF